MGVIAGKDGKTGKDGKIGVAILGYGVVGKGVAHAIRHNSRLIEEKTGYALRLMHVLDLLDFPDSPDSALVTHDARDIMLDKDVRVVVETMGGIRVAFDYTKEALSNKKHVVTSNKELVAEYGPELLELAALNGVSYRFDASVGGGIPLIIPIGECLAANSFDEISGILNGTTNYMLTYMESNGMQFMETLCKAQEKGYAEREPSADIDGHDACRKLAILSSIAYNSFLDWKKIHTEGIGGVTLEDVQRAADLGRALKLIARIRKAPDGGFEAFVLPAMISCESQLANVDGVFNAVVARGDLTGEVMFYGWGAGSLPTGSAIVADIVKAVSAERNHMPEHGASIRPEHGDRINPEHGASIKPCWDREAALRLAEFDTYVHGFYARVGAPDPAAYAKALFGEFAEAVLLPDMPPACVGGGGSPVGNDGSCASDGRTDASSGRSVIFTVPDMREGEFRDKLARVNASVPGAKTGFIARLIYV